MEVLKIRKVCVLGAGTMGSGIAAHLANLGFEVSLLDLTEHSVQEAFERARAARPPLFYLPERANEIRLGNIQDDLGFVSEADWVVEAIIEDLESKRYLLGKVDPLLAPHAMVSTNTSGLEISLLTEGRSDSFRQKFLGTHFFNPPRYLKLLELIPTSTTDPMIVGSMSAFLEHRVARRVVRAKDTPGFIANRFGMWSMFHAIHTAERLHLSIEQVDAITGSFLGRPRSASFRLNDIVGLDVMRDIASHLQARCLHDPHRQVFEHPASFTALLARGWIGEKAGRGYYRREARELLALDLGTFAYREARPVDIPSLQALAHLPLGERIAQALELRDEAGEFLRHHLVPVLRYADWLKEEVSESVLDFDHVLEWGFGWQEGPFKMIDGIGHERIGVQPEPFYRDGKQRLFDGSYVPVEEPEEFRNVQSFPLVSEGNTYRMRDLGDGCLAVSLTTKMGVISPLVVEELTDLLENKGLDRFVLTSEARSFSAGYDLSFFLRHIEMGAWDDIDRELARLQRLGELLSQRTCVAAVFGHCLGAGLELALSCSCIVAQAETQIGFPEAKVGLLPGGRGLSLMRIFHSHSPRRLSEVIQHMVEGTTSSSADHARLLGFLRPTDVTSYHPDAVLSRALFELKHAIPAPNLEWRTMEAPVSGVIDRVLDEAQNRGRISDYDHQVGDHMKAVVARSNSYQDSLGRERQEFLSLCRKALTHARIRHMLENGKPLRN